MFFILKHKFVAFPKHKSPSYWLNTGQNFHLFEGMETPCGTVWQQILSPLDLLGWQYWPCNEANISILHPSVATTDAAEKPWFWGNKYPCRWITPQTLTGWRKVLLQIVTGNGWAWFMLFCVKLWWHKSPDKPVSVLLALSLPSNLIMIYMSSLTDSGSLT